MAGEAVEVERAEAGGVGVVVGGGVQGAVFEDGEDGQGGAGEDGATG